MQAQGTGSWASVPPTYQFWLSGGQVQRAWAFGFALIFLSLQELLSYYKGSRINAINTTFKE